MSYQTCIDQAGVTARAAVGMGIPMGMGMGWVWGLKFNPHGSPGDSGPSRATASDIDLFCVD